MKNIFLAFIVIALSVALLTYMFFPRPILK
jgi:hypothetical protein